MITSQSESVRCFNRLLTKRIGALDESYLGRGRPLGLARLLFEIGPQGEELRALRARLALDSGYMTRLIKNLAADGLVELKHDSADRRRRRITLTPKGLAEHAAYDALSDGFARSILAPLSVAQRERLVSAMAEVGRLMTASAVTIDAEPEDAEDSRACVQAYYQELDQRFEGGFNPGSGGYAGDEETGSGGVCFLLARLDGRPVGCGALRLLDASTGEIKRMWIDSEMRGLGLAHRLLAALEDRARAAGLSRLVLDTNRTLAEAQALYRKAGYSDIARYNDNSYADFFFEKELR